VNFSERRKAEVVRSIYLLGTRAALFDDAAPADTQAHRSKGHTRGSAYATCSMPRNHLQHTDTRNETLRR
jgi:hypothetical protein